MKYHLRTQIAVAISLLILGVLTLVTWMSLAYFKRQLEDAAFNTLSTSIDIMAHGLEERILQSQFMLESLGEGFPTDRLNDSVRLQKYLADHNTALLVFENALVVLNKDGRLRASLPFIPEVINKDFSYREYFKVTRSTRHRFISRPFMSQQNDGPTVLLFTEPLLDAAGQFQGLLGGSVDLQKDNFLGQLIGRRLGENGFFVLLDNYDTVLHHPDNKRILESWRDTVPSFISPELWTKSRGRISQVQLEGREMLGAFQHISPTNWTLIGFLPMDEVFAPLSQARILIISTIGVLFVLTLWLIRRLTHRLTSPLVTLSGQVRKHLDETEKFDYPQLDDFSELGELSSTIRELLTDVVKRRRILQDQLTFLEKLVETIPTPIFYKDAGFRYIGCNQAFLDYIGFSRDELLGRTVFDLFEPDMARSYHEADLAIWKSLGEQVYESTVRYADGSDRDVIFHKKVYSDASGVPSGIIGVIFDIGERKEWENVLRESEARFRLLVENAADAFYLFNGEGEILDVNRHACLDLGYTREEFKALSVDQISSVYKKADMGLVMNRIKKIDQATIEDTFCRKDGTTFPAEVRICHVERDGDFFIALARDITERKQNESALRRALEAARVARDQVDNVLSSVADGVVVIDARRRVRLVNHVAERLLDFDGSSVIGKPFTSLFPSPDLREQAKQFLSIPLRASADVDLSLSRPEGQFPRIIQARVSPLFDDRGGLGGHVALLHDVTREREIDRVKSEFISTAAHELRTPLSVVLGYCELLLEVQDFGEFNPEQQKQFLQEIYKKGMSLTKIVDDLFDISRIEAGLPLPLDIAECDVNELLMDVVRRFSESSRGHRFEAELEFTPRLHADGNKLIQVFENLISNAVKYSPDGGAIKVTSGRDRESCVLSFTDHGIGMSNEQLERVFDKFYRADSSNTAVGGLGIGMSIVRAIIETHGGDITIESTLGQGTVVTISLPVTNESVQGERDDRPFQ